MTEGVKESQVIAEPENKDSGNKEYNFRRLETAWEKEKENRIKIEAENEMLRREMSEIKEYLKPKEPDPFDDIDEYLEPEVKKRLEAKLARERQNYEKSAEQIAKSTYERIQKEREEAEKKNFLKRLRDEHDDYDDVMNEDSLVMLQNKDPVFMQTALEVPDDYKRRKMTYQRLKALREAEQKPSVQDKVKKNQQNPYFIPASHTSTATAVDYDLNTKEGRDAALAVLRKAQRGNF